MSDENNEKLPIETEDEVVEEAKPVEVELPPTFVARRAKGWEQPSRPGKWTTIGCGLGIVLLIAALFAGSNLLRKAVWAGFAGTQQRLVANLPGDLQPVERMRLIRNLDRFSVHIQQLDEPFEVMGEFQRLARSAMEDRKITREEVDEINLFLENRLPLSGRDLPFSMPNQ